MTLELPRPLRSSLKKYNYSYSPGPPSTKSGGSTYSWAGSGTITNLETPPDSSLSEDSSYVSAKDSSFTSINSQNPAPQNRVRFSPITMVGSERMENLLDMPVRDMDPTVPLQAYRSISSHNSSNNRSEYSPKFRSTADYDKIEFLRNF